MTTEVTCSVSNCSRPSRIKGICQTHYMRLHRTGSVNESSPIGARNHGFAKNKTPEYHSWMMARNRCNNPNDKYYPYYGGRGIKFCPRWDSFVLFLEDMGPRPVGMTLDRKDGNKDYEPSNCRWATYLEQQRNREKRGIKL